MQHFQRVFGAKQCSIIGMIHVKALPGTPKYDGNFNAIIELAKHEASIYRKHDIVRTHTHTHKMPHYKLIFISSAFIHFAGCCFGGEYARRTICAGHKNRLGGDCVHDASLQ